MTYYIENNHTDPHYNLALEQYVFDSLDRNHNYFILWQNHHSIIIGKHQNTLQEINEIYVRENGIKIARRLSGGGAVYHDMRNLNFTFIEDADKNNGLDFSHFCKPVQKALFSLGVEVEISGRNDMTADGKKFSGNAQYIKQNRVMHHGTILYDSNLGILAEALNPDNEKIVSKGIKSVRSRVTNIRPLMKTDLDIKGFWSSIKQFMKDEYKMDNWILTPRDEEKIEQLKNDVYSQWSWNYGKSPPFNMRKIQRIESCGKIEVLIDVEKEGKIKNISFLGDFFGTSDPDELGNLLKGKYLEETEIKKALDSLTIDEYFKGMENEDFMDLIFS